MLQHPRSQSKLSYVETWKNKMKEAYQLAFQHLSERKTKYIIKRNTKRPCLTTLKPGDRVFIHDLSERGNRHENLLEVDE